MTNPLDFTKVEALRKHMLLTTRDMSELLGGKPDDILWLDSWETNPQRQPRERPSYAEEVTCCYDRPPMAYA